MRIRTLIALATASILVPMLLAAAIAFNKVKEGERQAALRGLHETVRASALLVDRDIQRSLGALEVLGNSPYLDTGDFESFYKDAEAISSESGVRTLLLDEKGRQIFSTLLPFETPSPRNAPNARLASVLETQQPLVSDLFWGRSSGRLLTAVYVPAKAAGGRKYIVAQAFPVDYWRKAALAVRGHPEWIVRVIDRQGRFIARTQGGDAVLGEGARPELVAAAASSPEGLVRYTTFEKIDAYVAFARSSLTDWTVAVSAPVSVIEAAARHAVVWLLAGMTIATALALCGAYFFGQQIVNAVAAASRAARSLGHGERPAPFRTGLTEVNALNRELLHAGELLDSERKARRAAEAQREELLANETRARESAQLENRAKDEFMALLGHELRNPLAAIAGAVGLLERFASDPKRSPRYYDIVRRQSRHLGNIVDDLMDVSLLLSGKIALDTRPVDLLACIHGCVESIRDTPAAEGYDIVLQPAERPLWVMADPMRLEQVISNLVTNALKYSRQGMEVRIEARERGRNAVIDIKDNGVGITADLLPHIFEPFVQGPPLANRVKSGLGIGLVLVKHLVMLHGGTVAAVSQGAGQGCTFTIALPTTTTRPPAPSALRPNAPSKTARQDFAMNDHGDARGTLVEGRSL
ncbi:sensor histidine kinase [Variovorax sp. J22R133]|uniref:sensor histidine kinase n=1 Tax=Variovorax brevis TaxID=3053503 RepID=UPI0025769C78|nr:sensor histidine kinase [Variovorax sp. J22R133]MDM0116544.1 sensor histidine kinase [Variovorax sp. J22R133]